MCSLALIYLLANFPVVHNLCCKVSSVNLNNMLRSSQEGQGYKSAPREDEAGDETYKSPVDRSNFLSFATFSWMNSIISLKNPVPPISSAERASKNVDDLEIIRLQGGTKNDEDLGSSLWKLCKKRVLIATTVYITSLVLGFIGPTFLMRKILMYASSLNPRREEGIILIVLLLLCEFGRVLLFTLTWALSYRTAFRAKSACMGLIYRKLVKVSSLKGSESSKILNVIANDCSRIYEALTIGQVAIGGPFVLIMSVAYIIWELGWISLIGMAVFPLAYPIQYLVARQGASLRSKSLEAKDVRVSFITQVLQHFKFIKMSGWEPYLLPKVNQWRDQELKYLRGSTLLSSVGTFLGPTLPHLGTIITFLVYLGLPNSSLRPEECFTILFVFSLVGYSVRAFSQLADVAYNTRISIDRIQGILELREMGLKKLSEPSSDQWRNNSNDFAIRMKNVCFTAQDNKNNNFSVHISELSIQRGHLIAVCGTVGSGKSTFLQALAGCTPPIDGDLDVLGRVAYLPQTPWLYEGSIRDNIIFGEPFDSIRYYNTIDACCLTPDFGAMALGDLTHIEGNGANLSGGQRSRVALARALYSFKRDICVLDSPFSSLDPTVTATIWERVIKGILIPGGYTIILSTHDPSILQEGHEVLLFREGNIVAKGSHAELLHSSQYYSQLLNSLQSSGGQKQSFKSEASVKSKKISEPFVKRKEDRVDQLSSPGRDVSWSVFQFYCGSAGGPVACLIVLFAFGLSIGSLSFASYWLKQWFDSPGLPPILLSKFNGGEESNYSVEANTTDGLSSIEPVVQTISLMDNDGTPRLKDLEYRNVYAALIGVIFISAVIRSIVYTLSCIKASTIIHGKTLRLLFSSRLKAVQRYGFGSLLNLFSRDMGEVDSGLPVIMEQFLQNLFIISAIFTLVSLVFPVFLIFLVVLFFIFVWIHRTYQNAVRELKREETERKTPILTSVGETISGLDTIRAYGKQTVFTTTFDHAVDDYHGTAYALSGAIRWLSIRLDSLAVGVSGITAILIILCHGSLTAAAAGLALSYAAQLSGVFQFTVRLASETEVKFVSVERIHKFLNTTPTETFTLSARENTRSSISSDEELLPTWPYAGKVKFDGVSLSYTSDNSRPALDQVSFETGARQKIAIIGRTGSGKSSVGNALFRLQELKAGRIFIDDVDISTLSIPKLRESLCVVTQESTVFEQQSVRFNIDPSGKKRESDLHWALQTVGLDIDNLDSEIQLSQGQKQLLCICRALLSDAKVVFVDEGTSSLDPETANAMDKLFLSGPLFDDKTVLFVTHRPHILSQFDAVLLLHDGKVRDFGPVNAVTRNPDFLFYFEGFNEIL